MPCVRFFCGGGVLSPSPEGVPLDLRMKRADLPLIRTKGFATLVRTNAPNRTRVTTSRVDASSGKPSICWA
jgi:hypothetical protein